jgi:hypothetical protein
MMRSVDFKSRNVNSGPINKRFRFNNEALRGKNVGAESLELFPIQIIEE